MCSLWKGILSLRRAGLYGTPAAPTADGAATGEAGLAGWAPMLGLELGETLGRIGSRKQAAGAFEAQAAAATAASSGMSGMWQQVADWQQALASSAAGAHTGAASAGAAPESAGPAQHPHAEWHL